MKLVCFNRSIFLSLLVCVSVANADVVRDEADSKVTVASSKTKLELQFGLPTYEQTLHYRKMYSKKPFPDAKIFYYDNGIYKLISEGENHYGVYVLEGDFKNQTYTIRYVSLPSSDWGNKTAFHQLTFINIGKKDNGVFIQNAITDTGDMIAQQNGTFTIQKNTVTNPVTEKWQ
ncbi:hypothetical protein [Cysteiniphilum sp. JM-1]|uniref:hypothetical protein n=1 Tax=Cysteiniphilum sp. JM-1 TaxID=2610891 RepID=UPI0012453FE0|nr:hypothetical protein [Cysteiniphilum sp. JM-1]